MTQTKETPEGWLGEIKDWQVVEANRITYAIGDIAVIGKVLIGPHEIGGQAFIPPSIWSNTPEDFDDQVTNRGWRHGVWQRLGSQALIELHEHGSYPVEGDESNLVWLDGTERPLSLNTNGLQNIVDKINDTVPNEFSSFAEEITANRIKQLKFNLSEGLVGKREKEYSIELRSLTANATAAFGSNWVKAILGSAQY